VNDSARIAELEERCWRMAEVLRAISARASNWSRAEVGEYYKAGQLRAYSDISQLAIAGLRWANGDAGEPE